jgi:hypothetical protein
MRGLQNSRITGPVPRLVPDEPLPPYSYVSGRFPHPIRDPTGHSHGAERQTSPVTDDDWAEHRDYLYGIDLFNAGYYWEAHEVWEGIWHACGRGGLTGNFMKGLIKLAAAGVKARERRPTGVRRHAARAAELFRQTQKKRKQPKFLGLELRALVANAARLADQAKCPPPSDNPPPVEVLIDFALHPAAV